VTVVIVVQPVDYRGRLDEQSHTKIMEGHGQYRFDEESVSNFETRDF
jgi:hypothetical protein